MNDIKEYDLLLIKIEKNISILSETLALCCVAEVMSGVSDKKEDIALLLQKKESISRSKLEEIIPASFSIAKYSLEYSMNKINNDVQGITNFFLEKFVLVSYKLFLFNETEKQKLTTLFSPRELERHIHKILLLYHEYNSLIKEFDGDNQEAMQNHQAFSVLTLLHFFDIFCDLKEVESIAKKTKEEKVDLLRKLFKNDLQHPCCAIPTMEEIANSLKSIIQIRYSLGTSIRPSDLLSNVLAQSLTKLQFWIEQY